MSHTIMRHIIHSVVLILLFQAIGANEGIVILMDQNRIECGGNLTLTCKMKAYASLVSWHFENNVIPIAHCVEDICTTNPKYDEKYKFTYDIDQAVFNLTIINLSINDTGKKLACSNGYESVSQKVSFEGYRARLLEDTEHDEITVTYGYILPDTTVRIQWTKINALNGIENEYSPKLLLSNLKRCSNVSACSANRVKHTMTISAKSSDNGMYYLKTTMTYGSKTSVSDTTVLKYNIEENVKNGSAENKTNHQHIIIGIVVISLCLWIFIVIILLVYIRRCKIYRRKNKYPDIKLSEQDKQDDSMLHCRDIMPNKRKIHRFIKITLKNKFQATRINFPIQEQSKSQNSLDSQEYFALLSNGPKHQNMFNVSSITV